MSLQSSTTLFSIMDNDVWAHDAVSFLEANNLFVDIVYLGWSLDHSIST